MAESGPEERKLNCPKCKGDIPAENVERGEVKRRASCPSCGAVFNKTSRKAGYGRRPVIEFEDAGGLDMPMDGQGPGTDPLRDPMRLLFR